MTWIVATRSFHVRLRLLFFFFLSPTPLPSHVFSVPVVRHATQRSGSGNGDPLCREFPLPRLRWTDSMNGELHACDSPYSKRIIKNLLNNVSAHSVRSYLRAGNNKNEIFKDPVAMCPRNFPLAAVYQAVHLRRFSELPRLVGFSSWKRKPTHTHGVEVSFVYPIV